MPELEMGSNERLVIVETEVKGMKETLMRVENKLDVWNQNYVPRQEINEMLRARDEQIKELKDDKTTMATNLPAWIAASLAAVAIVISIWPHN